MIDEYVQSLKSSTIKNLIDPVGPSLDCGCGDKRYTKFLPQSIGIDITDGKFEDFICTPDYVMNCEELKFCDEYFQNVGFYDVLKHTDNPKKAILEAYRVLKSNGCLSIIDPNDDMLLFARLSVLRFRDAINGMHQHKHIFREKDIGLLTFGLFKREKILRRTIFTGYKYRKMEKLK